MLSVSVASVALKSLRTVYEFDDGDSMRVCMYFAFLFGFSIPFLFPGTCFFSFPLSTHSLSLSLIFLLLFNIASHIRIRIRNRDNH